MEKEPEEVVVGAGWTGFERTAGGNIARIRALEDVLRRQFPDDDDEPGGGVREPREPHGPAPSGTVERHEPTSG